MDPDQFLALADLLPERLFLLGADSRVRAANRAALRDLDVDQATLRSQPLYRFVTGDHAQFAHYLHLCAGSGQALVGRVALGTGDGLTTDYRCEGTRVGPADGEALICLRCEPRDQGNARFVVLNQKIAELDAALTGHRQAETRVRELNEELEQRITARTFELTSTCQKLESFSYSVSHDLRAPLRNIQGFARAVLDDHGPALADEAQDFLTRIVNSAGKMEQLIDDLLEYSTVGRKQLERERVSLSRLSTEIVEQLVAEYPGRSVDLSIARDVYAEGDPQLLRVVMDNLLGNAWKYTGKVERACIEFGERRDRGRQVYMVRDNGAGFDPHHADKLFIAFQRLHSAHEFEGTGVGLATVKRIINSHGGDIWAKSCPGNGATFYFTLAPETT